MIVEEVWKGSMGNDLRNSRDQFPIGMRVLAVDDDPTCLKLLETLLIKCQYKVTTTRQAVTALKLLRENKNKFDLVISDVHMPDMDGFKLLELVGLEMDLPVIMLSGNSDTKAVMKGITHGACDYLLKPVRIEELKNIWQHVVRRRKFDNRGQNNLENEDGDRLHITNSEGGHGLASDAGSDRSIKHNKKRKDEDDNDSRDNTQENEDPSTQKKPRVVWSIDLHQKFVAAVRQLGGHNAVPNKILKLMNVEGITRENVASHLQKYRLYLRRLTEMSSQQANVVAAMRARDPYMSTGSFNGFGTCHASAGSRHLPAFPSYGSNAMLGRINSLNGYGWQGLPSSGMIQFGCSTNAISTPSSDLGKVQAVQPSGYQEGNLLHGIPLSSELDQLEQNRIVPKANASAHGGLAGNGLQAGNNISSNPQDSHTLLPTQQHTNSKDPFDIVLGDSSSLVDLGRCKHPLEAAVPSACCSGNTMSTSTPISHEHFPLNKLEGNGSISFPQAKSNYHDLPSSNAVIMNLPNSVVGNDCQNPAISINSNMIATPIDMAENVNQVKFRSISGARQNWGEPNQLNFSAINCSLPNQSRNEPPSDNLIVKNNLYNFRLDIHPSVQTNHDFVYLTQQSQIEKFDSDQLKDDFTADTTKLQCSLGSNNCSLDDLVNGLIKSEQNDLVSMDGDAGYDVFSVGPVCETGFC